MEAVASLQGAEEFSAVVLRNCSNRALRARSRLGAKTAAECGGSGRDSGHPRTDLPEKEQRFLCDKWDIAREPGTR